MLDVTRWESRRRAEVEPLAALVSIPTRKGLYFIPWRLECLQALLQQELLSASDLLRDHADFQPFMRRLFMLATQEALCPDRGRTVQDFARKLRTP